MLLLLLCLCYFTDASLLHLRAAIQGETFSPSSPIIGEPTNDGPFFPGDLPAEIDCRKLCSTLTCPKELQYTPADACCPKCMVCSNGEPPLLSVDCRQQRCPQGYQCNSEFGKCCHTGCLSGQVCDPIDSDCQGGGVCFPNPGEDCNDFHCTGKCVCPGDCPEIDCPPQPYCHYGHHIYDEHGCPSCGRLICDCPPDQEFLECGGCTATCENPTPVCAKVCHPGCFCKKGTVLDTHTGSCVPADKCGICEGEGGFCGGITDVPCPVGAICIDTFTDDCIKGLPSCRGKCKCEYPLVPSFLQQRNQALTEQNTLEP